MILFIEPISTNTGMYVPAYPLPVMEVASYVKFNLPDVEIKVISIPMDYGLPLNKNGKKQIEKEFLEDLSKIKPKGIGISCTAIPQAEEVRNEIPVVVCMIAVYPSNSEQDLQEHLAFAIKLSKNKGPGGYIFKIGECRVYPETKNYDLALSLPDVVFDDDGVFGQNIAR
jgi:hypothetical protein